MRLLSAMVGFLFLMGLTAVADAGPLSSTTMKNDAATYADGNADKPASSKQEKKKEAQKEVKKETQKKESK